MVRLWQWIKNQIVQDIPEEIALCEFDCHKQQCTEREWLTCPRRYRLGGGSAKARLGKQGPSRRKVAHSECLTSSGLNGAWGTDLEEETLECRPINSFLARSPIDRTRGIYRSWFSIVSNILRFKRLRYILAAGQPFWALTETIQVRLRH